jgi:hypothetical protein
MVKITGVFSLFLSKEAAASLQTSAIFTISRWHYNQKTLQETQTVHPMCRCFSLTSVASFVTWDTSFFTDASPGLPTNSNNEMKP